MRITKKILSLALSLIFSVMVFTGCGGGQLSRQESQKLTFMHIWPEHASIINEIMVDFTIANPEIEVEIKESNYVDITNVIKNAYIGGTLPDVFFQWTNTMNVWVPEGIPMDISDVVAEIKHEYFGDGYMFETGKVGDKYYGLPFRGSGFLVYYNKTIFNSNKWDVPTSLEELESLLPKIKATGLIPLAAHGGTSSNPTQTQILEAFNIFASYQMGMVEDPNYFTGRLEPEAGDYTYAYTLMKQRNWIKAGYYGNSNTIEEAQQQFLAGNAAMALINNNDYALIKNNMPEGCELGVFSFPAPEAIKDEFSYVSGGIDGFCISSMTDKPEQAKKLLKYLASKEVQEKFAKATQSFMYNKDVVYEGDYQSIANALKWINRYATVPDFNIGAYANRNKSLLDSIVAGAGTKTFEDAKSAQLEIRSNMLLGMQDKIMNPPNGLGWIKPVYTKKTYDDSWLTN